MKNQNLLNIFKLFNFLIIFMLFTGCDSDDDEIVSDDDGSNEVILPDDLPDVSLASFSNPTSIDNIYYGPDAGQVLIYEAGEVGEDPSETIRIERRSETRVVMGVTCMIQQDVVMEDGVITEDTDDWLAQDDDGNVWYFGEFSSNFDEDGDFLDNEGSWEAGVDGALPGYWLPANPSVGMTYLQEYDEGEAEDFAIVEELGASVTISLGTYENCLVTRDINPFEENVYELKYYAPNIGLILEEKYEDEELVEIVELVSIE